MDDNDRVMEMVIVMAVLGLFPVLMPTEDENCGVSNFSGVLKRLCVCVCVYQGHKGRCLQGRVC